MARNFDGTDDRLESADGAVAALDVDQLSWSAWVNVTTHAAGDVISGIFTAPSGGANRFTVNQLGPAVSGYRMRLLVPHSVVNGSWNSPDISTGTPHHLAVTYDRSSNTNDPAFYVDGVSVAVTEIAAPSGTPSTPWDSLIVGDNSAGTGDLAGVVGWNVYQANLLWDASAVNRARWWGRPHGGLNSYYPLVTEKLADEGSIGAAMTATGTTVASLMTPCVRPGTAMMGMGIGW